jgi:serine/threonine-protein kinase SRPK3
LTFTPHVNRDPTHGFHRNVGSAQRSYDLPIAPIDWAEPNMDETASEASEEEDLEDYCKGGYHPVEPGQVYKNGRYTVVRKLGWGHFSTVWLARDNLYALLRSTANRIRKNRHVALKVVRSATQYKETALDEIKLLEKISSANPAHPGRQHIVSLLDHFEHSGPNGEHVCLVFEALGESVLSTIKRYQYRGLPIHIVKQITKQVLLGLDYLHRECGVIHTDLKPENVLISIDNAEEVIAETSASEPTEVDNSRYWKLPQPPRYPSQMEHRMRPRRFITRSQPLPSPASVVPKSFSNELGRIHGRDTSISPTRNGWQNQNDPHNAGRSKPGRENTADNLERDLSDMSLDYQLRKSQLAASRKRFSQDMHTIKVKIIDVGNACWVSEHFTNDLQTRQYRSPEVILGAAWGASADVWSMSCMVNPSTNSDSNL